MRIRRVERYEVDGQQFESVAKAKDYCDGQVNKILQKEILARPNNVLSITDIVGITDIILKNRKAIVAYLSANFDEMDF